MILQRCVLALLTLAVLAAAPAARGQAMFRRMFVTGNSYNVGVGGFLGPNARAFADYEATFAAWDAGFLPSWNGIDIVYTAFLSHGDLMNPNARDRINLLGEPVFNTRFEIVWRDSTNYLTETPENSWGVTEFGGSVPSNKLWTGSDLGGDASNDCGGWTNSLGAGQNGALDILTFGGTASGCGGGGHFIAIGPPEPLGDSGETQLNPIPATVAGPDDWVFANADNFLWYDLPLADQLDFTAQGGAQFSQLNLPSGFTTGEGSVARFEAFEVLVGAQSLGLFPTSGEVNFLTLAGGAVQNFTIRGIGAATPLAGVENFPVRLSFAAPPADFTVTPSYAADFNGDGAVNGADLATWAEAFGDSAAGDIDGDGDSDGADLLAWQRRVTGGPPGATVPEPGGITLLLAPVLLWRRPRRAPPALCRW